MLSDKNIQISIKKEMFAKSSSKVTFQDLQLDDYVLENSVLKSKLQSKIDALSIMSNELDKCCMERDRYKVLVEQLGRNKAAIPRRDLVSLYGFSPNDLGQGDMLTKTTDQNCLLKLEVESLKSQLDDAMEDITALRKALHKKELENTNGSKKVPSEMSSSNYELLVQELEKAQKKYQQIQLDYRATLDEKEELSSDRDYYKTKVQRLNQQISYILSNRVKGSAQGNDDSKVEDPPKSIVDIDAIVMENKYLHERITQLEVEKEIIKRTLNKYKTLLNERSKNERSVNLKKGFLDIMTQRQVRDFLDINSKTGFKRSSIGELKSLCLGLFEALNDKSIALQHQRKTNQILANRINELEKTLESWCNGQKYIPIFPSELLLDDFLPDHVSEESNDAKSAREIKKIKYESSEEKIGDLDNSLDININSGDSEKDGKSLTTKTVLPLELELLVKEALADMNITQHS